MSERGRKTTELKRKTTETIHHYIYESHHHITSSPLQHQLDSCLIWAPQIPNTELLNGFDFLHYHDHYGDHDGDHDDDHDHDHDHEHDDNEDDPDDDVIILRGWVGICSGAHSSFPF